MTSQKYTGLTKTQEKQLEITRWATVDGWRPDPVGRPQLFNVDKEGVRIRIRFFERSIVLERRVPLTEEERQLRPNQNMHWVEVKKRAYSRVSIRNGKLSWDTPKRKTKVKEEE